MTLLSICRAAGAVKIVGRSVWVAPKESWDSVKTTAGAALDLVLLPEDHQKQVSAHENDLTASFGFQPIKRP